MTLSRAAFRRLSSALAFLLAVLAATIAEAQFDATNYSTGMTFYDPQVVDIEPDGDPDIVGQGYDSFFGRNSVRALVNDGAGNFSLTTLLDGGPTVFANPEEGSFFDKFFFEDLNFDGRRDMVLLKSGNFDQGRRLELSLQIFVADAAGVPQLRYELPLDPERQILPSLLELGNANNDPALDLFYVEQNDSGTRVRILFGLGDGTFIEGAPLNVPKEGGLSVGDFNRDGLSDLLVADQIYHNLGAGRFQLVQSGIPAGARRAVQLLNEDFFPDIAVSEAFPTGSYDIFYNDGTGRFFAATGGFIPLFGASVRRNFLLSVEESPQLGAAVMAIRYAVNGGYSPADTVALGAIPPLLSFFLSSVERAALEDPRSTGSHLVGTYTGRGDTVFIAKQNDLNDYQPDQELVVPDAFGITLGEPADVDGDGDIDLPLLFNREVFDDTPIVGGTFFPRFFAAFVNDGSGTLTLSDEHAVGTGGLVATLPPLRSVDLNSDAVPDFVTFNDTLNPRNSQAASVGVVINDAAPAQGQCARAVPGDYDGDGVSDFTVARNYGPYVYWFHARSLIGESGPELFGLAEFDRLLPADFTGDGKVDKAVVRDWFGRLDWLFERDDHAAAFQWGLSGDVPLVGYVDANCKADVAVVRASLGGLDWYIRRNNGSARVQQFGLTGDIPFLADFDGDGVDDLVVARRELAGITWYTSSARGGQWGLESDEIIHPTDVDGDGKADLIVARNINGFKYYFIRYTDSNRGAEVVQFGLSGDIPFTVTAERGRLNFGVYRESASGFSAHYARRIGPNDSATMRVKPFGLTGDTVVLPLGGGARMPLRFP